MSVYDEIVLWSQKQPLFIRDAIRRLFEQSDLSENDCKDLLFILKSEVANQTNVGVNPVSADHIPTITNLNSSIHLKSIENPNNISSLYQDSVLSFSETGLSVIYGKNGSGKSSYSKILKRCCWSRDKNTELKTNIFTKDASPQSVVINFSENSVDYVFKWTPTSTIDRRLNSIKVFDSKCAYNYLNAENPAEYKPVGIDVLEKLIKVCTKLNESIDLEIKSKIKTKPLLEDIYSKTSVCNWYQGIDCITKQEIEDKLLFSDEKCNRMENLKTTLAETNIADLNQRLQQQIIRFKTLKSKIETIHKYFSTESVSELNEIKEDFRIKKDAYDVAQKLFSTKDPLDGVGSETWKQLWMSAKAFALSELHCDFPSDEMKRCPLCQQALNGEAEERLYRFNQFVLDKTSKDCTDSEKKVKAKIELFKSLKLEKDNDTLNELIGEYPNVKEKIDHFLTAFDSIKREFLDFLEKKNSEITSVLSNDFLVLLNNIIDGLNDKIQLNDSVLKNRSVLEAEYLELAALNSLTNKKQIILDYYDELQQKRFLNKCKEKMNTRSISLKIGELLESKAIGIQREEFYKHLNRLNKDIASKVSLDKTRTKEGKTYQKCTLKTDKNALTDVLSEGEQKIVALANFLSECTIENSLNTIVFDDPITSLDQDYREEIASIIVELSQTRQVIVLTHDLYFVRFLSDVYGDAVGKDCHLIGLTNNSGVSGIISDEIPYLAKNVQERINSIRKMLKEVDSLALSKLKEKEIILVALKDRMRQLLERTVEDVLINKTITRFSKNINFKKNNLSSMVVVEKSDIDFLLELYGKYSEIIHDGSIETLPKSINEKDIEKDLKKYEDWKKGFEQKRKNFV